jgi:ketosteroid isomerase-like protein
MSKENVEIVRQLIQAWNQRDSNLALRYLALEVEWAPAGPAAVERPIYRGHDQVSQGLDATWEAWEEFHFEGDDFRDLDDSVLWLGRVQMRGGTSHLELDQEWAIYCSLRDGKVFRIHAFSEWQEGLEAAGLSE